MVLTETGDCMVVPFGGTRAVQAKAFEDEKGNDFALDDQGNKYIITTDENGEPDFTHVHVPLDTEQVRVDEHGTRWCIQCNEAVCTFCGGCDGSVLCLCPREECECDHDLF